jgi:hypothetical protein
MQNEATFDRVPERSERLSEQEALQAFHRALSPLSISRVEAVSIWIGLKAKHGMILQTPGSKPADPVSRRIARIMLGDDWHRMIQLQGHPWWAVRTSNQPQLVLMQQRLSSLRLNAFLADAAREFDDRCTRFILLRRIGRAELDAFYGRNPQRRRTSGSVFNLPWDLATAPAAVRDNLIIIATEGQPLGLIDQREILDSSVAITLDNYRDAHPGAASLTTNGEAVLGPALAAARSLNPLDARALVPAEIKADALRLVGSVLTLLDRHGVKWEPGMLRDAYLFIGHAWDRSHRGLFSVNQRDNLKAVEDFWLSRSAIPRIWRASQQRRALWPLLSAMLTDRYPMAEQTWRRVLGAAPE